MKTKTCLHILIAVILCSCSSHDVHLDKLQGRWLLTENSEEGMLVYKRISPADKPPGSVLEITPDSIIDSYHLECRTGMASFFSAGTWNLDRKSRLLKSSVPIDLRAHLYRVTELDSTNLILAPAMGKDP